MYVQVNGICKIPKNTVGVHRSALIFIFHVSSCLGSPCWYGNPTAHYRRYSFCPEGVCTVHHRSSFSVHVTKRFLSMRLVNKNLWVYWLLPCVIRATKKVLHQALFPYVIPLICLGVPSDFFPWVSQRKFCPHLSVVLHATTKLLLVSMSVLYIFLLLSRLFVGGFFPRSFSTKIKYGFLGTYQ